MDVREKLVELLQDCNNPSWKWFPNNAEMVKLIDYLIAHGVTVQECAEWEECVSMTNAQKIRAMSDEELAEFIVRKVKDIHHQGMYEGALAAWFKWLKKPSE